jgi:4-amino-4-deoxy-L-arabinose transferase-like glycosyltransferase
MPVAARPHVSNIHNSYKNILIIVAFAVIAMLPAYWFGLPSGNDQSQHYQFAWTVYNSVKSGDIYPSFAPGTNHGFGDYGLRFYPPLTYYVLAGLRIVTGDWYFASMIALTLVFFTGALGIYLWTRDLFDERTALIAAALYTFIPYHLNEIYNNALLAEFFATAVLPFCFLYLHRTMVRLSLKNALLLAVSTSLLVLTHLPLTLIGGIAMAVYAVCLIDRERLVRQLGSLALVGLLTAAMTAFYWPRWLPELAWITHNTDKYFSTTWDYRSNFLLLPTHWTNLSEDVLNLWFADLMLIVGVVIALPAAILVLRGREKWRPLLPLLIMVALAALMTTPLTEPLWNKLSFLQKTQFPWRWLAVVSMFAAVLGAVGITRGLDESREKNVLVPGLVALSLASLAFMSVLIGRTPIYITHSELKHEISTFDDSTGCDCWWPVWAKTAAFTQKADVIASGRDVTIKTWSPGERVFVVAPGAATTAMIKTWYYPRWMANVNGGAVEAHSDENGALTIDIPPDTADVSVRFVEPSYVRGAGIISLLAWIIVAFIGAALLIKSRGRASPTSETFQNS